MVESVYHRAIPIKEKNKTGLGLRTQGRRSDPLKANLHKGERGGRKISRVDYCPRKG